MNRATLRTMLRDANALPIAAQIIGASDDSYHVENEAVIERLRTEAAKLIAVAERLERFDAGAKRLASR